MKLVSYIAKQDSQNLFDDLFCDKQIWADKYDIEDVTDLNNFIVRLPTMRDCSFLIINLVYNEDKYQNESIISAINRLANFTSCKPVFILKKNNETATILAGLLAEERVRNIIYCDEETTKEELSESMNDCLSDVEKGLLDTTVNAINNSMQQIAIDNTKVKYELPQGKLLQIAVAGTKNCIGTTTQCISIAYYLKKIGLKPLVVTFDNSFYTKAKIAYDLRENLFNVITINDIDITTKVPESTDNYNTLIYDFCVLQANETKPFLQADISVLIASSRAWDLGDINRTEENIKDKSHLLWFNFCNKEEYSVMQNWDLLKSAKLAKLPYINNPFSLDELTFYHSNLLTVLKNII